RHAEHDGGRLILRDDVSAGLAKLDQPGDPVVPHPRQDHAHRRAPDRRRNRAEEVGRRWLELTDRRAARELSGHVAADTEVDLVGCDVYAPREERFAVLRQADPGPALLAEPVDETG